MASHTRPVGRRTRRPLPPPGTRRQRVGLPDQVGAGIAAEHKAHAGGIPPIQVTRLREIGIAAERQPLKARRATQRAGSIESLGRPLRRRAIAAPVDEEERLPRVGQRHHQGMVAPHAVVRDVHAFLTLPGGLDQRAVRVDDGFLEKPRRLRAPDPQPRLVDRGLQRLDGGLVKAAAEIARGGRVGNPLRAQGIEIHLILPPPLNIL